MPASKTHKKNLLQLGEFGLIDLLRKKFPSHGLEGTGIGDDAAVLKFPDKQKMLLTTDMLIEGVHFDKTMPLWGIGHKAIACSISDIAAMGGEPLYALVSIGVPARMDVNDIYQIYQSMHKTARDFGVKIVGGDTVASGKIVINICLVGTVLSKHYVLRSTAKAGDKIFVTGALGNSLKSKRHLSFTPRVKEARYLVQHFQPRAMIDISDGLAQDLFHILKESRVGARLYENAIPVHPDASLKNALFDGEDYELLFTVSASGAEKLKKKKDSPFVFIQIGEITGISGQCVLINARGKKKKLQPKGYDHFQE